MLVLVQMFFSPSINKQQLLLLVTAFLRITTIVKYGMSWLLMASTIMKTLVKVVWIR